jgi:brefeldin A-inhibited guanine nucleotide-exchange protein
MNIISKIGTLPSSSAAPKVPEPSSPPVAPASKKHSEAGISPSLNMTSLTVPGSMDTAQMGLSEHQLKRQALECLVTVLRSLVAWGTTSSKGQVNQTAERSSLGDDKSEALTPDQPFDQRSLAAQSVETFRQPTPDQGDDPTIFESAKQKKTTLLEGIKKFNFKPKRVCPWQLS